MRLLHNTATVERLGWHAVKRGHYGKDTAKDVKAFLDTHPSSSGYNNKQGCSIWYFEDEQDAVIFKLRFG